MRRRVHHPNAVQASRLFVAMESCNTPCCSSRNRPTTCMLRVLAGQYTGCMGPETHRLERRPMARSWLKFAAAHLCFCWCTQFLGACTKQEPYILITELMAGGSMADTFRLIQVS